MHMSDLYRPSLARWLSAVACDWAIILAVLSLALWFQHWAVYFVAILVIGNRQHALAILGHDGGHRLVCRNRRLNDVLSNCCCFWPMLVGLESYRRFHFAHHRETGSDLDPELIHKKRAAPHYDLPMPRRFLQRRFLIDLVGGGARELLELAVIVRPVTWGDRLGPLAWWTVVGGACVVLGVWVVIPLWFGAMITGYWACFRLRIWTEHMGTEGTHRVSLTWWQRLLFAPHNTWYHYEHHRWPSVPCHLLPAARGFDETVPVVTWTELLGCYHVGARVPSGQACSGLRAFPEIPEVASTCAASGSEPQQAT